MQTLKRKRNDIGWLLPLCALIVFNKCMGMSAKELTNMGMQTNVTCIAHDSQFTCDCNMAEQNFILPPLIGSAYALLVRNCKSLTVNSNALQEADVHKISFLNVENLILHEKALAYPQDGSSNTPWTISFEKVKIALIDSHAIKGQIKEITIVNSHIDSIKPFAFNILNNNAYLFKMDNVKINRIEAQAFKKLVVENIDIQNCVFQTNVPSKSFYDVEVTDTFYLNNISFKEVHTKAFSFKLISKLIITNNYFEGIDAEWMEAYVKKSPQIKDNYFGTTSQIAFKGIKVHRDYRSSEKLELRFSNNTVHFPYHVQPLEFNGEFTLNIKQLNYANPYPCQNIDNSVTPLRPKEDFFNHYKHFIYFMQEDIERDHIITSAETNESHRRQYVNEDFKVLSKIVEIDCQEHSSWIYIIIGAVCLVVVIAIIIIIVCWRAARKRKEKRKMDIVQPEPRTYKETQIVYQIENAGLLKTDF